MHYVTGPSSVELRFFNPYEVEVVRESIREQNDHVSELEGEQAVKPYHRNIEGWQGYEQNYAVKSAECLGELVDALERYSDEYHTEQAVDNILKNASQEERIERAAKRYRLSHEADKLLMHIETSIEIGQLPDTHERY